MKIAIFSDSHDHIWNLQKAINKALELGVETIIHCGDLISPFMLEELDIFPGKIHLIYGNNTGDQALLARHCQARTDRVTHHGWMGRLNIEGVSIGWIHDPSLAYLAARSGEFDLVCYGHTHRWRMERVGQTVLLNPGEILGKKEPAGWALLEITQNLKSDAQSSRLKAKGKEREKGIGQGFEIKRIQIT